MFIPSTLNCSPWHLKQWVLKTVSAASAFPFVASRSVFAPEAQTAITKQTSKRDMTVTPGGKIIVLRTAVGPAARGKFLRLGYIRIGARIRTRLAGKMSETGDGTCIHPLQIRGDFCI